MPRYLIERTFPDGLNIPVDAECAVARLSVVEKDEDSGLTWMHSYVSDDRKKSFCICDGPSPESIRRNATENGLPVDHITEVSVLSPFFN